MTSHRTDSRNVAHLWANGATFRGIKAAQNNNGQFYYTGRTIWSYGRHFPVATLLEVVSPDSGRAETIAIFNDSSYGITTSKHQSYARSASHQFESHSFPLDCNLTDALERLSNGRPFDDDAAAVQRAVKAHPESGAGYPMLLLTMQPVGVVGGESYRVRMARHNKAQTLLNAWRKARTIAAAKAVAANVKRERERMKADIIHALKIPLADFKAHCAGRLTDSIRRYGKNSARSAEVELARYRAMHKAASALKWAKRKVALWERVGIMAAALKAARQHHDIAHRHDYTRREMREFRSYAKRHASGEVLGTYDLGQWHNAANWLFTHAPGGRSVAALLTVATEIDALRKERATAEERARFEREAANRAAWLAGETVRGFYGKAADGTALIRAVGVERDESGTITGGTLETSQGASVPLTHAVKVLRMIAHCRATGRDWQRNGATLRVGHYQVDRITAAGDFKAGCHEFGWAEVARLAGELGLDHIAPADTTTHA